MNVEWLGDPHLGRKFETGVPLHRKGDRERMQWEQFRTALLTTRAEVHVTMGDLFDKFIVPPEVVLRAVDTYRRAAEENPNTLFVVLRGNHDVSRNAEKASSFDLFDAMLYEDGNIWVISDAPHQHENMLFIPYDPFNYDYLEDYLTDEVDTVYSHFDIVDFGGHNVIPTELFARHGIKTAINGHDHNRRNLTRHGVEITVTGSMQPYSHAEDADGTLYITCTLDELASLDVREKNVRVLLHPGETLPVDLDCLSLTAKRLGAPDDETATVDTTEFDAIDLDAMLCDTLAGLSIAELVVTHFRENHQ